MEITDILRALERNTGVFPRAALEAAVERREEITPELLRILEETIARADVLAAEDVEEDYFAHIHALFLLAQFREGRAYPLVVQLARQPEDVLESLLSDIITEDLACILASVCGGDTTLIESLVESPGVDEYVRGAALESLLVLVAAGDKTRDEVMGYFGELFDGRLERSCSHVWGALVSCARELYPGEVHDQIVAAYQDGLVDTFFIGIEDVEEVLELDRQAVLDRLPKGAHVYIRDIIEEMEGWACFDRPKRSSNRQPQELQRQDFRALFYKALFPVLPERFRSLVPPAKARPEPPKSRPAPVPRAVPSKPVAMARPNEPCPCGSGKKYKKCCGRLGDLPASKN